MGASIGVAIFAALVGVIASSLLLDDRHGDWALVIQSWSPTPMVLVALAGATAAAEAVVVKLPKWDVGLIEAAVVVNALLLPVREALAVTAAGLAIAYVAKRTPLQKATFNLGTHVAASAALLLVVRTLGSDSHSFDGVMVISLLLGTACFTIVNLALLGLVLAAAGGMRFREFLREESRRALTMSIGTAALGAMTVSLALNSPVLLPAVALPAAAISFAYWSSAQGGQERQRSARILAFSQVLASNPSREQTLQTFAEVTNDAFAANVVIAFTDPTVSPVTHGRVSQSEVDLIVNGARARLIGESGCATVPAHALLPPRWGSALISRIDIDGGRSGIVVVGRTDRARFSPRDRTLLTSMTDSLVIALKNADNQAMAREEANKFKAVVEQSNDGIFVVDDNGIVHVWNAGMTRLSGYAATDVLGSPLHQVLAQPPQGGGSEQDLRGSLAGLGHADVGRTVECQLVRHDGECRTVRCSYGVTQSRDGQPRYVGNVHDITRERRIDRLKADFIATVSHELRTPVTPIKGYADLLLRRGDVMAPDKRASCLKLIIERADHLARLVEDLLLTSRISHSKDAVPTVEVTTVAARALVDSVLKNFTDAAGRFVVNDCGSDPVRCDPVRASQVLSNLVSNALKYSPPESLVKITIASASDGVQVSVADTGRGIPADQIDLIFEKFHRVEDPQVMTTSGTGLGLFIAQRLARAMGGDVSVRSTLGKGSVFTLRLPDTSDEPMRDVTIH